MEAKTGDAKRKETDLAIERTMLAWWRTGLASLAVALAVGRLLPELTTGTTRWPYVLLGLGFGVFATGLFLYGTMRGGRTGWPPARHLLIAAFATVLALGTMALIAVY